MKVDGYGNIKSLNNIKKRYSTASVGGFSDVLGASMADDEDNFSAVNDVSAPIEMSSLLALQEISDEDFSRKKSIKHGENVLDSLEDLRKAILIGNLPLQVLRDIEKKISTHRENFIDPKLSLILDEIELRAAVEIAKIDYAIENKNNI